MTLITVTNRLPHATAPERAAIPVHIVDRVIPGRTNCNKKVGSSWQTRQARAELIPAEARCKTCWTKVPGSVVR